VKAVRTLLLGGLGVVVLGVTLLVRSIAAYLSSPVAASSTSGVRVFRLPDGSLGGFDPFVLGYEPVVIGVGVVLVAAAMFLGAQLSSRSLLATAGENADAQIL